MHDHRQVEFACESQLAFEIESLRFGIEAFDEEIQPAFADRDRAFAFDPVAQFAQMPWSVRFQVHRVRRP